MAMDYAGESKTHILHKLKPRARHGSAMPMAMMMVDGRFRNRSDFSVLSSDLSPRQFCVKQHFENPK